MVSLKFIPLSFITSKDEIIKQIKNTVVFSHLFETCEETTLNNYIESTQYGFTASALENGSHKMLRITDINHGKVNWENVPFCDCENDDKYLLEPNDILVARTGGTTGKSFIVQNPPSNAVYASYLIRIRLKDDVNIEFINAFLNSYCFWSQITEMKSGSAQPNVNAEKLKTLVIPNCDLEMQSKAVEFLNDSNGSNSVSEQIKSVENLFWNNNEITTELSHQLELISGLRQAFLREAMQGKLVPQDDADEPAAVLLEKIKAEKEKLIAEKKIKKQKPLPAIKPEEIPFEIPNNWTWCRLGELGEIKRGKSPKYDNNGVSMMLNQKCIRWFYVDASHTKAVKKSWFEEIPEDFIVRENDILINSTGEGTIGRSAIADAEIEGFAFDSHVLKLRSAINQSYICYFINSSLGQQLVELLKGATSTKQTELGVNNLSNFTIPLPPLAEQKRIVEKLETLISYCDELEENIKKEQKQSESLLEVSLMEALQK